MLFSLLQVKDGRGDEGLLGRRRSVTGRSSSVGLYLPPFVPCSSMHCRCLSYTCAGSYSARIHGSGVCAPTKVSSRVRDCNNIAKERRFVQTTYSRYHHLFRRPICCGPAEVNESRKRNATHDVCAWHRRSDPEAEELGDDEACLSSDDDDKFSFDWARL